MPMFTSGFLSDVAITAYNTIVCARVSVYTNACVLCASMRDTNVCVCSYTAAVMKYGVN